MSRSELVSDSQLLLQYLLALSLTEEDSATPRDGESRAERNDG